jgi:hypothetical protein
MPKEDVVRKTCCLVALWCLVKEGVSVSLAHTIEKDKAADNPLPLGQKMTLDEAGHAMDLYTIWYHGSVI